MKTKRLGFLGAGNMCGALVKGLLQAGVAKESVIVSDVRVDRLEELRASYGIRTTATNKALFNEAELIVLAVKPQVIDAVLTEIATEMTANHLVISIAAGIPLGAIEGRLPPASRVIRAMPNTPAMVQAGATAVAPGRHATQDDMRIASELFQAVGRVVNVGESQLDAVTGLSGSGPAYVMLVIEALADGGVKMGLSRDTAILLAAQTVAGGAQLLMETGDHPGRLKDAVTSPGGTTIAGLHALENGGLRAALMNAVEAAAKRSAELGREMEARLRK